MAAITLGRFAFGWSPPVQSIRLGFLAALPFRREDHADEGWISLDFLGFSRPNRDFSTGYEARSGEKFNSRFSRGVRGATDGACARGHADGQNCSWGELNLVSDFLQ
jgi:hypothetical protein